MEIHRISAGLHNQRSILLRALIVTAIVNIAPAFQLMKYGAASIGMLSDNDEVVYLSLPILRSRGLGIAAFFYEYDHSGSLFRALTSAPNAWLDTVLGFAARAFGAGPQALGLSLDLIIPFISYLAFTQLFRTFGAGRLAAEVAAWTVILHPLLMLILPKLQFPFNPLPSTFSSYGFSDIAKVSVVRAVYTQVSYPLFAVVLTYAASRVRSGTLSAQSAAVAGLSCAALFYVYLFAWATATYLVFGLIAVSALLSGNERPRVTAVIRNLCVFLVVHFAALVPSILLSEKYATPLWEELRVYIFFSPERTTLGAAAAALALAARHCHVRFFLLSTIALCMFGEQILNNLQWVLGRALCPYHFAGLFLFRVADGAIVCLLISEAVKKPLFRPAGYLLAAAFILAGLAYLPFDFHRRFFVDSEDSAALLQFLRAERERKVIAMLEVIDGPLDTVPEYFSRSVFPMAISALTGHWLLHQEWIGGDGVPREELLKREMASVFWFTGKPALSWPCVTEPPPLPGDLYTLTWTYNLLNRIEQCRDSSQLLKNYSACDALRDFRTDYVLWAKSQKLPKPDWYTEVATLSFRSPNGEFELYSVSRERALVRLGCSGV